MKIQLTIIMFMFILSQSQAPRGGNSNRHFSHSLISSASAASIWDVWTDVPKWKDWDGGLKDASLAGDFALKAKGKIISLEGRKSGFRVVAYSEGKSYTFRTALPLGALYVKRILSEEQGQTRFTHEVWFTGLTGGLFAKQFGPKFRELLPEAMEKIREIAEGR